MNRVKNATVALMMLGAVASYAEIKLTDNLSTSGFLDMSAVQMANEDTATYNVGIDQLELDFMFKFGESISARADINSVGGGDVTFEQGFITGTMGALSISTGRFLSSSGFEAAEPTGMYQYSWSKNLFYGGYQNGINFAWTSPMVGLYAAVVTDLWVSGDRDFSTPGFEGQVSVTASGLTAKATYLYQMYDEDATGDASQQLLNVWASYAGGPLTVAAEYNLLIDWIVPDADAVGGSVNDGMGHGWLVMGNFKFTDRFAGTLRYSGNMLGDADPDQEVTVSPSFAISPNWLALAEFRVDLDMDPLLYTTALETTFSF